jgi:hypothetical protein
MGNRDIFADGPCWMVLNLEANTLKACIQEAKRFLKLAEAAPIEKVVLRSGKVIDFIDAEEFEEASSSAGELILKLADLRQGR